MTEHEKQAEVDNLIAVLKQEGMPYPMTGGIASGHALNSVLGDCRRLVTVARKTSR
jgi:hypothetical protein